MKELKSMCSEECYNFEIIDIDTIENNDVGYKLLNDYGGGIGLNTTNRKPTVSVPFPFINYLDFLFKIYNNLNKK